MQLRRLSFWLSALALAALVPSLTAEEHACRVTTPPNPPFVTPAPYEPNAADGAFWYGTNSLWTQLPRDGVWRGLPRRDNGGYFNKLFLWQQGYDGLKEPQPDIILVLKRQDAPAPPASQRGGTNAHFGSWAMLTGIVFPSAGCWQVTAYHAGHLLTFVLSVEP